MKPFLFIFGVPLLCLVIALATGCTPTQEQAKAYDFQPLIATPEFAECWAEWERFYQREGFGGESRECARWNTYDECVFQVDHTAPDYPGRPEGCL